MCGHYQSAASGQQSHPAGDFQHSCAAQPVPNDVISLSGILLFAVTDSISNLTQVSLDL